MPSFCAIIRAVDASGGVERFDQSLHTHKKIDFHFHDFRCKWIYVFVYHIHMYIIRISFGKHFHLQFEKTGGTYELFLRSVWWSSDLFPCFTSQFFKSLVFLVVDQAPPCLPQKDMESRMQQSAYNIPNHAVSIIYRQQPLTLGSSPYFMLSDQSLVKSLYFVKYTQFTVTRYKTLSLSSKYPLNGESFGGSDQWQDQPFNVIKHPQDRATQAMKDGKPIPFFLEGGRGRQCFYYSQFLSIGPKKARNGTSAKGGLIQTLSDKSRSYFRPSPRLHTGDIL